MTLLLIAGALLLVATSLGWVNALLAAVHPKAALIPSALFPFCAFAFVAVIVREPREFVRDTIRSHGRVRGGLLIAFVPLLIGAVVWLSALMAIDAVGAVAAKDVNITRRHIQYRQFADEFFTSDGGRYEMVFGGRAPLGRARIHIGASGRVLAAESLSTDSGR